METQAEPALPRRERRRLDRRQAIVDAARTSFLAEGYAGTSMSSLTKTLGGSKATLWSYFRSKEDLFAAVMEDVSRSFRAELESVLAVGLDGDVEAVLVAFCRVFVGKITSPEALATWRLVVAESGRFPEVGRIFVERSAGHTHMALTAFLSGRITAGQLLDEDAAEMAKMLIGVCVGHQTHLLWGGTDSELASLDDAAARFARWFVRAFAPSGRHEARRRTPKMRPDVAGSS